MRPRRETAAIFALALAAIATAGEPFERFARRLGLADTLRAWQIDRLRTGPAPVRREAARALSADRSLLASGTLAEVERREVLRMLVAALPVDDAAGARARLELARQSLAEATVQIDALRGGDRDRAKAAPARQSLAQAAELIDPVLDRRSGEPARTDPLASVREAGWLLDGWRTTLSAWLDLREGVPARPELLRAIALFAGLLDAPLESPTPAQASADLLRGELGADAALGLATALQSLGQPEAAAEWMQAIERGAPATQAARRVPAARLAFAIDSLDPAVMREALDALPTRSLPASLAVAAARVAARKPGADAAAVITAALDAMDADTRATWLARLAETAGPMQPLAAALAHAAARADAWRRSSGDAVEAGAIARELDAALASSAGVAPAALRAEAHKLRAFALRASGDAKGASMAFEVAGTESAACRGECLWLAALAEPAQDAAGVARRLELLRRQREADPAGPFAGRAATWLSRLDGFPSDALAAAVLMEVRDDDPFVADARAEAARRMLAAAGRDAQVLQASGRRALQALEPFASQPGVARWRLAAAIAADDLAVAQQAQRDLSAADRADPAVAASVAWLDLLRGDAAGARAAIEALPQAQREVAASAACARLASMQGVEARAAEVELACLAAELVPAAGARAARERLAQAVLRAADAGIDVPAPLATRAATALASVEGASRMQRSAVGESLRMAHRAAEAIEPLQALGASLPQGSEPWAEARWRLYRCLREVDADRAATMLRQHMALAPDGGPAPWGERFLRVAGGAKP